MCTIGGLRDYVLVRDTALLKGVGAMLLGSWVAFGALRLIGGSGLGHELIVAGPKPSGLAAVAALSSAGSCSASSRRSPAPARSASMSLPARAASAPGRSSPASTSMAIVYTSWISPHIGSWVL